MKSHVVKVIRDSFLNVLGPKFINVTYEHLVQTKFGQHPNRKSFKDKPFTISKVFLIIL
jgi:hypothetical protein